jgi:hypothetical protein
MTVYKSDWIVLVAVAVALFGGKLIEGISLGGGTPAPAVPEPSPELQAVVKPIAALVAGENAAQDRAELSAFCLALAEFHGRDKAALVKTTKTLADHNAAALQALYQSTGMTGRYAGLGASIDKALGGYLGVANADGTYKAVELTAATAAKTAEFYQALAWAFQ